jgi:hypothetical protein
MEEEASWLGGLGTAKASSAPLVLTEVEEAEDHHSEEEGRRCI